MKDKPKRPAGLRVSVGLVRLIPFNAWGVDTDHEARSLVRGFAFINLYN